MTIEQIKTEAKARLGKEITDEQAKEWLENHADGKLNDEELDNVTSGACGGKNKPCPKCGSSDIKVTMEVLWHQGTCRKCGHKTRW